ncbi:MAG TPA: Mur ligase family protein, partial [Thermodesulfovibrionales bacterium]|nr:Mur ligase family protein [Thermodesulfovibrionales bacterium]
MRIKAKKAVVFGLGRSGVGAANLLSSSGVEVIIADIKPEQELKEYIGRLSPSVKLCLGGYPLSLNGADLIVISPGVPQGIEPIVRAREKGIKVIGELELAFQAIKTEVPGENGIPALAVTGSNGKSTTTTVLDLMLREAGFRTLLGGNIGISLTEEISKIVKSEAPSKTQYDPHSELASSIDFIVAEVSSFQLETIDEFKPMGAAILNITPDHLDRYHSMKEYREAKAAIFRNQDKDDFLVLNADDPETMKVCEMFNTRRSTSPIILFFSRKKEVEGVYCRGGIVYVNIPDVKHIPRHSELIGADEIKIKGVHNLENAMASTAMALLAGCPPEAVAAALLNFPGLEHRLEFVRELDGVRYVNDSKGTNVGAVMKSLEGFESPVILIAGGRDKAGDFTQLRPFIEGRVRALVL